MKERRAQHFESWRIFRIMGEFVDGIDELHWLGPAVTIFGSSRTNAQDPYYKMARETASRLSREGFSIITGAGPGIMEAGNRGAAEAEGDSIGLHIDLPHEQECNEYVNHMVAFRYFFIRKYMLVRYANAFVIFPGGFGTMDELFEVLTLIQTHKVPRVPVILAGKDYWQGLMDWIRGPMLKGGNINAEDPDLVRLSDDLDEIVGWVRETEVVDETGRDPFLPRVQ